MWGVILTDEPAITDGDGVVESPNDIVPAVPNEVTSWIMGLLLI